MNYYNEFDPHAAAWLRELIRAGLIPAGDVDTRSITEIKPHELTRYTQCHFFAGIGGWSYALELAGWEPSRKVWTGSCPCQPFSSAGKGLAQADERHLWPVFFNLIRECRPECVFGEQVASAIGKGWLDGVSSDLEGAGYACGATVLGAHSVGSPHIRQRLYWVADAGHELGRRRAESAEPKRAEASNHSGLGNPFGKGLEGEHGDGQSPRRVQYVAAQSSSDSGIPDTLRKRQPGPGRMVRQSDSETGSDRQEHRVVDDGRSHWARSDLTPCADGKARRIEPGLAPLAHGVPARVVRLRGYGNAIVPQVAAQFIAAYGESR